MINQKNLKERTIVNAGYNLLAHIWPIIFSIFLTPIIVLKLGVQEYGLFLFVNTVSGFIGVMASGISASAIRDVASKHKNDTGGLSRSISTANATFLIVAIIGVIAMIGGFLIGFETISRPESFTFDRLMFYFSLAAFCFFIQTSTTIFQIIPGALQRFDITSKITISTVTMTNIGNLILVLMGYGIGSLFILQTIVIIITATVWYIASKKLIPELKYEIKIYIRELKENFSFGSLNILNDLARTSLITIDRILIPIFAGTTQLTYYSIPGNVSSRIPGISDNLSGVIFPTATNLHASGQKDSLKKLYIRSTRLIMTISIAITVGIIFNAEKIMRYWFDENFATYSTKILIILAVTNLILSLLSPVASFLMGINRMKFYVSLSATMAIINIILLFTLLPTLGIEGAAFAYLFSVLPIFYAIYFIEKNYLEIKSRGKYYINFISKHIIVTLITVILIIFVINPLISNFLTLVILGPVSVLLYLILYVLFGFMDKEDSDDILSFIKKFHESKK